MGFIGAVIKLGNFAEPPLFQLPLPADNHSSSPAACRYLRCGWIAGVQRGLIVKWHCAFNGLMSATALLLPLMAVPESRIESQSASSASSTAAHVNFKVVIPQVLYLHVAPANDDTAGANTVGVMSSGRNVTLNATIRTTDSNISARRNVILNAAARKAIVQDAQCAPAPPPGGAPPGGSPVSPGTGTRAVICTASMP
jgi:hypothetical protein